MYQVLVAKNLAYAAKTGGGTAADPSELAPGAFGVFTSKGVLITSATLATVTPDLKSFVFAVGTSTGITKTTPIQRDGIYDFRSTEYADPVKQVSTVTLTGIQYEQPGFTVGATPTYYNVNRGDEAIVRVVDETIANIKPNIQSYTTPIKVGDTPTTIAARLVNNINTDGDAKVVATSAAGVLTLTGKDNFTAFKLAIDGVANQGGTVAYTTPHYSGAGTAVEVAAFERLSQASTQMVHEQAGGRGSIPTTFQTADGTNYDTYFLDTVNRHHSKDAMDATYGRFIPVMVAFPDTATAAEAELELIMPGLISMAPATAPETGVVDSSD